MMYVAPLRYEVIFKKAFSQPDVFMGFVKDMTGVTINIDQVETEKRFDPPVGRVDSRFDLYAEDKNSRTIVDIQHVRYTDHYHRFMHYHCAAMLEQAATAKDYHPELQVLTLVVLTSGDKHKADIATTDFDPKDRSGKPLHEIPHRIIYLCPPYVSDDTPEPYREWLRAINDSMDEQVDETAYRNALVQKIFATIERDHITPQERAQMKDEYGYEAIGRDQYQKGLEQGIKATALAMLDEGMDVALIAKLTGLSREVIGRLG